MLYFGARWLVAGSSALALAMRISPLVVGLTVVAYGTSAPEVVVSVRAVLDGLPDVAIGNVLGSNIANIGLILGLSALISPARVDGTLRRREVPVLIASTLVVPPLLFDGVISRIEAAALVIFGIAYTVWMIRAGRSAPPPYSDIPNADPNADPNATAAPAPPPALSAPRALATAIVGLLILLLGGNTFVRGAVGIALTLGLSERLVGLTIVAVGTSLPELVTSLIAARSGQSDIAIGNIVGSNIFNVFLCLGIAAMTAPAAVPLDTLLLEIAALFLMTTVAIVYIRGERIITRLEGAAALGLYVIFTALTVFRG